ncbi:TPA: hypothetical protein HJU08_004367 [Escherichia coli]|uniref:hypothetical protein n=1 Tax=Escherichia coli TaxID=562 RepID=UPI0013B3EB5F|nr:hypothetical protein [Escherichia coli]EEC2098418.1 hypothetical protein [Salmonella enterica subsp. enterica serovar Enteritidis]ELB8631442.1 hypothetical protein [Salmonella enterica]MCV2732476.1 hypothetical protein [Enterobacter hormaechei]EEN3323298.1 hypothetical protein [Salmonella enterica subsp. enterica serovar Enteritidis]MCV2779312.1 hypothetical protein [Enterobacter hormaechei]
MKIELTYDEITEQATKTITEFMEQAKSADSRYSADFFYHAAWGAKMLWLDLIAPVKNDPSCKLDCFLAIKKQSEIFEQLVDRESVPALNNEHLRP